MQSSLSRQADAWCVPWAIRSTAMASCHLAEELNSDTFVLLKPNINSYKIYIRLFFLSPFLSFYFVVASLLWKIKWIEKALGLCI